MYLNVLLAIDVHCNLARYAIYKLCVRHIYILARYIRRHVCWTLHNYRARFHELFDVIFTRQPLFLVVGILTVDFIPLVYLFIMSFI